MDDAAEAIRISTENGAAPVRPPVTLRDDATGAALVFSEIKLYGDCVLRFVSGDYEVRGRGEGACRVPRGGASPRRGPATMCCAPPKARSSVPP